MTRLKYIAKQIIFPIFQASVIIDLSSYYLSSNFSCWDQRRPCCIPIKKVMYHNYPNFLDRQIWADSVDPDQTAEQQSDQGLPCLPFHLHLFDALLCGKDTLFNFYDNYCYFFFEFSNMSHVMTKPAFAICKQHRRISAYASAQSDQLLR